MADFLQISDATKYTVAHRHMIGLLQAYTNVSGKAALWQVQDALYCALDSVPSTLYSLLLSLFSRLISPLWSRLLCLHTGRL